MSSQRSDSPETFARVVRALVSGLTSESCDALDLSQIPDIINTIEGWIQFGVVFNRTPEVQKRHKEAHEAWLALGSLLKEKFTEMKERTPQIMALVMRTIGKYLIWKKQAGDIPRSKGNIDYAHVTIGAIESLTHILTGLNADFQENGFCEDNYQTFRGSWEEIFNFLYSAVLQVDSPVGCAMLDALAATGNNLFSKISEDEQKAACAALILYSNCYAEFTAFVRAKVGRVLAKFVEFPSLSENMFFFMDVFEVTAKSLQSGESAVVVSYAWAFGNLTDILVRSELPKERFTANPGFVETLLETAKKCIDCPMRGRYSVCRAWGNIFHWVEASMMRSPERRKALVDVLLVLERTVGSGQDYKLRWNAAQALGQALGNKSFIFEVPPTTVGKIIHTLAKWMAQSQNYKERCQCIIALSKAKWRAVFGDEYPYVWTRICASLTHLPGDESESDLKFKTELVFLVIHLIDLLTNEDISLIEDTIAEHHEALKGLFEEIVPTILLERLDVGLNCQETMNQLLNLDSPSARVTLARLVDITEILYQGSSD